MPSGLPYYPMYVYDFDESDHVLEMNLSEAGLYLFALNEAWKRGSIPDDPAALATRIRKNPAEVKKAWLKVRPCWVENGTPGKLINPRQEKERVSAMERSATASLAGLASASARKRTNGSKIPLGVELERSLTYVSGCESVSPSGLELSNNQSVSTRVRILIDAVTQMRLWCDHRGFKKPQRGQRPRITERMEHIEITESEYSAGLDGYHESAWAKQHGYPIFGFLKDPLSWIPADANTPPEAEAPESHPEAPLRVELALVRNYLAEWNAAVPQALATWHAKYSPAAALRECSEDPEFQSSFGGLCVIAERIHAARGAEVGWLTFEWLLKAKAGESPGWLKLRGMGWMAKESSDDRMVREIEEEQRRSA